MGLKGFRFLVVVVGVFASMVLSVQAAPTDVHGPPRSLADDLDVNFLEDDPVTVYPLVEEHSSGTNVDKDSHGGEDVTTNERYYRVHSDGTIEFKTALSNGHIQYQRITNKVINNSVIQVYRGYFSQRHADGRYATTYYVADENGYRQTRVEIGAHPPFLPFEGQVEARINEKDLDAEIKSVGRSNESRTGVKAITEPSLEASSTSTGLEHATETSTALPMIEVNTGLSTELPVSQLDSKVSTDQSVTKIDTEIKTEVPVAGVYTAGVTELPVAGVSTELPIVDIYTEANLELTTETPVAENNENTSNLDVTTVVPIADENTVRSSTEIELEDKDEVTTEPPAISINGDSYSVSDLPDLEAEITTEEEVDAITIYPSSANEHIGTSTESVNVEETSKKLPPGNDGINLAITELSSGDAGIEGSTLKPISEPSPSPVLPTINASVIPITNDNSTNPIEVPGVLASGIQPELPITVSPPSDLSSTDGITEKTVGIHVTESESTASVHQF